MNNIRDEVIKEIKIYDPENSGKYLRLRTI